MSGQWEVVNRAKKKQNGQPPKKLTKTEKQKVIERAPKVEEVLPLSQVQTLFDDLDKDDKENKKPGKENLVKDSPSVKQQKKQPQQPQKKKEPGKEKPAAPKTLEAALKLINIKELSSELGAGQARFPDAPLIWLKGLVVYLNTKLTVGNIHPTFTGKGHDYPKSLLPGDLRDLLNGIVKDMEIGVAQPLFEWCLTAMANDMSRGSKAYGTVLGHKLMLQMIAWHKPEVTLAAVPKVISLQESYMNQQPIGQSLLWAIGQGGYQCLGTGLQVWYMAMLPMLELRHYSTYVLAYLDGLLQSKPPSAPVSHEQLMPVLTVLSVPPAGLPSQRRKDMQERVPPLLNCVRHLSCEDVVPLFPALLQQLSEMSTLRFPNQYLSTLTAAVVRDELGGIAWAKAFGSSLPQSKLLLEHLVTVSASLDKQACSNLKKALKELQSTANTLQREGVEDPCLVDCQRLLAALQRTATATMARASRGFPWLRANLLLLAAIAALVAYDVRQHRSFRASTTGRLLRDVGALPHVELAVARLQHASAHSYRWFETNAPIYCQNAWEVSQPYVLSARDMLVAAAKQAVAGCQIAFEFVQEKAPLVAQKVEEWAPGLRERSAEWGAHVWEQTKVYSVAGGQALWQYGEDTVTWARTNVFVGSWSPDNLQQYSLAVLNVTQEYALGTYDWLYQKVQTLSKVP